MPDNLKKKAISGMLWTSIDRVFNQVMLFFVGIILARILSPSDFGIVGMITFFISIANIIIDSGFAHALIQNKKRTEEDYSTVFFINVGLGIFLFLIVFFAAPFIAEFYKTPVLTSITRVYGLIIFINSLTIVQTAKLTIELRFKQQTLISVIATVVASIISIIFAFMGYGVWALVIQVIIFSVIRLILFWYYSGWIPSLIFSQRSFKRHFIFGSNILVISLINSVYENIYSLLIGRYYKASQLGFFNRANQFAMLSPGLLQSILLKVTYPVLVQIQDQDQRLNKVFIKIVTISNFLLFPITAMIIIMAPLIVHIILGEKWMVTSDYIQIISVGAFFMPTTAICDNLLMSKGKAHLLMKLNMYKKTIGFAIVAITITQGMIWICWGAVALRITAYLFNSYWTERITGIGIFKQMKYMVGIFLNTVFSSIITLQVKSFFDNKLLALSVGVVAGIVTYAVIAYITKNEVLCEILKIKQERK